jgi:long-chain acyl-CoA synthetase
VSTPSTAGTVAQAFQATAAARANYPALRAHGSEIVWTWRDYHRRVRECAAGLAGLGCERGETLACWLTNRPEFHVADAAASHLGVGALSVHPASTADEAAHVIREACCRVLVTEKSFLDRALQIRSSGGTGLRTIVCLDSGNETTLSWQELIECRPEEFDLGAAAAAVTPDDLLTVIYALGTDGPPTLARLTHADVLARVTELRERLALGDGWRTISWQPMAGIVERLCTHYLPLVHGWQVTTCADPDAVAALLAEIRPEFFSGPPGLWERLRDSVLARFDGNPERAAADRPAVLAGIGLDQLRSAIVAAAPSRPELIGFWHALGVPLDEVRGLWGRSRPRGESIAAENYLNASSGRCRDGAESKELNAT